MEYGIHPSVLNIEQLKAILDLKDKNISRIYIDPSIAINNLDYLTTYRDKNFYLCSPYVFRQSDVTVIEDLLSKGIFKGILVRNLETFSYLNVNYEKYEDMDLVLDCNMYILNMDALMFYQENSQIELSEYYTSFELNSKEQEQLQHSIFENGYKDILHSSVVYGRIPMMVSANCINKTLSNCVKNSGFSMLEDRYNKGFPIYSNCEFCYNVIYNCVPLSLHNYVKKLLLKGNLRLDFTNENINETKDIVKYFLSLKDTESNPTYSEYTTGHYKRGIE